jgi:hypothetical protein
MRKRRCITAVFSFLKRYIITPSSPMWGDLAPLLPLCCDLAALPGDIWPHSLHFVGPNVPS